VDGIEVVSAALVVQRRMGEGGGAAHAALNRRKEEPIALGGGSGTCGVGLCASRSGGAIGVNVLLHALVRGGSRRACCTSGPGAGRHLVGAGRGGREATTHRGARASRASLRGGHSWRRDVITAWLSS